MGDTFRRGIGRRSRNERSMIRRIYEAPTEPDDEQHDRHLQDNYQPIDERGFFSSANQQQSENKKDEYRRNVYNSGDPSCVVLERRVRPLIWNAPTKPVQHTVRVFAPG